MENFEYNSHDDCWYKKLFNRHGMILYFNDKNQLHRTDGPAKIYKDIQEWWFNGNEITKEFKDWANQRDIDINNLTDFEKIIIKTEFFSLFLKNSC